MKSSRDLEKIREKADNPQKANEEVEISISPILIGILVAVIVVGVGIFFLKNKKDKEDNTPPKTVAETESVKTDTTDSTEKKEIIYEDGERAFIESDDGNYYFQVAEVKILPKTGQRDAVYQVFWEYENDTCTNGLEIDEYDFKVVDSDGCVVRAMSEGWEGDWSNSYDTIYVGEKCKAYHTFVINDEKCKYLDVKFDKQGLVFRVNIGANQNNKGKNTSEKIDVSDSKTTQSNNNKPVETEHGEEADDDLLEFDIGDTITVQTENGDFEIILNGIAKSENKTIKKGKVLLDFLCTVKNNSYSLSGGISLTTLQQYVEVFDDQNDADLYRTKRYSNTDYMSLDDEIKQGDMMKVVLPYWIDDTSEKVALLINQEYLHEVEIDKIE